MRTLLEGSSGRPYLNAPSWHKSMDLTIYQFKFNPVAMTASLELREPDTAVPWPFYITKSQYAALLQELGAENIDTQDELRIRPMTKDVKLYMCEWSCLGPDLLARHGPGEFPFDMEYHHP